MLSHSPLHALVLLPCPQGHPFVFIKGSMCLKLSSLRSSRPISCCRIWDSGTFLSLRPPSVPFSPRWRCCWLRFSRALWDYHIRTETHSIRPEPHHRSCLNNPISISGFCLDAEGIYESHPWSLQSVLCEWRLWPFHPPGVLAKGCRVTPLTFPLEHTFLLNL